MLRVRARWRPDGAPDAHGTGAHGTGPDGTGRWAPGPAAEELDLEVLDPDDGSWSPARGLAHPDLVGPVHAGDRVLLNTTALDLGLGTGGYALVVAVPGRLPVAPPASRAAGHMVKARYTPLQTVVMGVDEQASVHHATLRDADDLTGMAVVVADLHSAVPAVVAGVRAAAAASGGAVPRVAYVMTDGGALPAAFSRTVSGLRAAGWLQACITAGQAFGGDLDAVGVHSALLAARHVVGADVTVVAQGPGNLGTGTRWGFSGVAAGEALNAAGVLGGRPVAALRVSGADARERHRGLSHHSVTAYGRVALVPCDVVAPLPTAADPWGPFWRDVHAAAVRMAGARHRVVTVPTEGLVEALRACPVRLSTMGRGLDEDAPAFVAAAAAGVHAARPAA